MIRRGDTADAREQRRRRPAVFHVLFSSCDNLFPIRGWLRRVACNLPAVARLLLVATFALIVSGCVFMPARRQPAQPVRTRIDSPLVILPAQTIGNLLLIEVKWDRHGPYRFLIDTGSSVTLVTPALARRYPGWHSPSAAPRVRVTGANGTVTELPEASLRRLELGDVRFDDVPVLIYDCAPLSAHLGVRIDGVLGFPLFRETVLTLDYPGSRVLIQPAKNAPLVPGTAIAFDAARKTPLVSVKLGDRTLVALIDSGSDMAFSLNPVGIEPEFVFGPVVGATVGTIAGDRTQRIGRLAETLAIGEYTFPQPVVDLSDELSAIGGGVLKHFAVTFDQTNDRVTFYRESRDPIATPPRRSGGLSFNKTPAYWRVAGVVPDSSAEAVGVQPGDLVTRIQGEPVSQWDLRRYEQLVATAQEITFTFLNGSAETEKRVAVFELVP